MSILTRQISGQVLVDSINEDLNLPILSPRRQISSHSRLGGSMYRQGSFQENLGHFIEFSNGSRIPVHVDSSDDEDSEELPPLIPLNTSTDNDENPDNNYINMNQEPPSRKMSFEELLKDVLSFCDHIFTNNYEDINPIIKYSNVRDAQTITITSIIFEINMMSYGGIKIFKLKNPVDNNLYKVNLEYGNHNPYSGTPSLHISSSAETLNDALTKIYKKALAYNLCGHCKMGYDTNLSPHCVTCLFSDFFVVNNPEIKCSICLSRTKDFKTLECGHRFHFSCLVKTTSGKCPLCRAAFDLQ